MNQRERDENARRLGWTAERQLELRTHVEYALRAAESCIIVLCSYSPAVRSSLWSSQDSVDTPSPSLVSCLERLGAYAT
ncbi:hypothetical protein GCM10009105_27700 [Dokdonella soli]|uniref:Uncharacterized protein n=1 Tax=Dokdonella soli TaxID=529810 RepID=A0ABN1IQE7_9GAMM